MTETNIMVSDVVDLMVEVGLLIENARTNAEHQRAAQIRELFNRLRNAIFEQVGFEPGPHKLEEVPDTLVLTGQALSLYQRVKQLILLTSPANPGGPLT